MAEKRDMAGPALPAEGGCRCGQLRFRVTAPPMMTSACHCRGCQRMSASAFSLTAMLPSDGFAVIAGESALGGLKAADQQHHHCPECMSWVFTTFPAMPAIVNLRATMLDEPAWFAPFIETYVSEKLPWATTPALHSFEKFPDPGSYQTLMAEFAAARQEERHG